MNDNLKIIAERAMEHSNLRENVRNYLRGFYSSEPPNLNREIEKKLDKAVRKYRDKNWTDYIEFAIYNTFSSPSEFKDFFLNYFDGDVIMEEIVTEYAYEIFSLYSYFI